MIRQIGYDTIGGSPQYSFTEGVSCRFVVPDDVSDGRISKGVIYIQDPNDTAIFAIYSDDAGNPRNLLAHSNTVALTGTGWYNFSDLIEDMSGGLDVSAGSVIHLAIWTNWPGSHFVNGDPTGSSNQFTELNQSGATYPTWSATVTPLSQSNLNLSIYIEYSTYEVVLGYPSIGDSNTGTYTAPAQLGCLFTSKTTVLFDSVYVRMNTTSLNGRINAALYTDNSGSPDSLVCKSGDSYGAVSTTNDWYSCPLRGGIKGGLNYWLVISCDQDFIMKYDLGSNGKTFDDYTTYATWGNPYNTTPDSYYGAVMSFYLQNSAIYFGNKALGVNGQFRIFNGVTLNSTGNNNNLNKPEVIRLLADGSANTFELPSGTASCVYLVDSSDTTTFNPINIILPDTQKNDVVGIKKLSGSLSPIYVQAPSLGASIDGLSILEIYDQYEEVTLVTDDVSWFII
jgi:hypothetical protein